MKLTEEEITIHLNNLYSILATLDGIAENLHGLSMEIYKSVNSISRLSLQLRTQENNNDIQ